MSKKTFTVLQAILLLAVIVLFSSCESHENIPDKDPDAYVRANPNPLTFSAEGGTQYVYIESSYATAHDQLTPPISLYEANGKKNLTCKKVKQEDKRETWEVTCPPNYTNEAREFILVAWGEDVDSRGVPLAQEDYHYFKTDTIRVKQEAGDILAKLADLKIDPGEIEYQIRNDDSNWQFDDDPTMLSQPYLDKVRGLQSNLDLNKGVANTRVVDGKYLVDIDLEYPNTWGYDPDDNIPRLGADYLSKMKISLTIGVHSDEYGEDFIVEKGTLYFNEEGRGTYTNPVNGANGGAEYATHIELDLKNLRGDRGPTDLLGVSQKDLDRGVKRSLSFYYPGYVEDDDSKAGQLKKQRYTATDPSIIGTGYKKFFAMPNGTEVKPATAKSGDNKQWNFSLTLWYAN